LAFLQILSPALSVALSSWKLQISVRHFLWMLMRFGTTWQLFELFGTSVIAAVAIYMVKRWSYPVFLSIFAWGAYSNYAVWHQYPQVYSLMTLLSVNIVNLGVVSYFLLPAVSAAYFNPRLRWWESKPRYRVDIPGSLKFDPSESPGSRFQEIQIVDISEGGVYVIAGQELSLGQKVDLNFTLHHVKLSPEARVVHQGRGDKKGYGIQFTEMGIEEHRALKRAVRGLDLLGYERRNPNVAWYVDLYHWATHLFRTGKGLLPEVPGSGPRPKPAPLRIVENSKDEDVSKAA
jgi:hypothetical protein